MPIFGGNGGANQPVLVSTYTMDGSASAYTIATGLDNTKYASYIVQSGDIVGASNTTVFMRLNNDSSANDYAAMGEVAGAFSPTTANGLWCCPCGTAAQGGTTMYLVVRSTGASSTNQVGGFASGKGSAGNEGTIIRGYKITGVNATSIQLIGNGSVNLSGTVQVLGLKA